MRRRRVTGEFVLVFACLPRVLPLLALALAGCVDEMPDVGVGKGDVRAAIAKGALRSPRAATVAFASLEGAPPPLDAKFVAMVAKDAADREITMADPKTARYLVRGYLSAAPTEGGTELAYVYDLFDGEHRRIGRVNDVLTVPGTAPDAWALLDDKTMASLAGRSADDLAVALAGTPEAQAGLHPPAIAANTPVH